MTNYEATIRMTKCAPPTRINPWLALAQGIVLQGVNDWRALDAGIPISRVNYIELRTFFNSQWCEHLLIYSGIHPSRILQTLEEELRQSETAPLSRT